jgi:PIN domain nuclease of toxin-antitoxin system
MIPTSQLLDNHTLLWVLGDHPRLSALARSLIEDPSIRTLVNVVSCWEIAIKAGKGHLKLAEPARTLLERELPANNFNLLPITLEHATAVEGLPLHHKDPFDRLLIAQAMVEGLPIGPLTPTRSGGSGERSIRHRASPALAGARADMVHPSFFWGSPILHVRLLGLVFILDDSRPARWRPGSSPIRGLTRNALAPPGPIAPGFHAHRAAGGDRHHRRADCTPAAGGPGGSRGRSASPVHK